MDIDNEMNERPANYRDNSRTFAGAHTTLPREEK